MKLNLIKKIVTISLIVLGSTVFSVGQKLDSAKVKPKKIKFKVAKSYYTTTKVLVLQVSLNKKNFVSDKMLLLTRQIRCKYINERKLGVNLFTKYKDAKRFSLFEHSKYYQQSLKAIKGIYYLNKDTDEEYVRFLTIEKENNEWERIDIKSDSNSCKCKTDPRN